jgi:hypothetical protein
MTLHNHYKNIYKIPYIYIKAKGPVPIQKYHMWNEYRHQITLFYTWFRRSLNKQYDMTWMLANSYELEQNTVATDSSGRNPWVGTAVSNHAEVTSSGNSTAQWALLFCQVQFLI